MDNDTNCWYHDGKYVGDNYDLAMHLTSMMLVGTTRLGQVLERDFLEYLENLRPDHDEPRMQLFKEWILEMAEEDPEFENRYEGLENRKGCPIVRSSVCLDFHAYMEVEHPKGMSEGEIADLAYKHLITEVEDLGSLEYDGYFIDKVGVEGLVSSLNNTEDGE